MRRSSDCTVRGLPGGTVLVVSVQNEMHRLRPGVEGFEAGTPDFVSIAAIPAGLSLLERIGMQTVQRRVEWLTDGLLHGLAALRHADGSPRADIHGPLDCTDRGGTVAFNVRAADGSVVPHWDVEARAAAAGVSIRGGCFCNPGAAEHALALPADRTAECIRNAGKDFTISRFKECIGDVPVGAVRASVGIATLPRDIDRLLDVLAAPGLASVRPAAAPAIRRGTLPET